jgi:hypothetical protein
MNLRTYIWCLRYYRRDTCSYQFLLNNFAISDAGIYRSEATLNSFCRSDFPPYALRSLHLGY